MAESDEVIEVDNQGPVRWLWLNRPRAHNAQNVAMLEELVRLLAATRRDASVRVLVLAARGPTFSAGHDFKMVGQDRAYAKAVSTVEGRWREEERLFVRPIEMLRDMAIPTVCRLRGPCLAAGILLPLACDLVVAEENAYFQTRVLPEFAVNDLEVPALAWALGERLVKPLLWLGEPMSATEAFQRGLVSEVVPAADLDERVSKVAGRLAELPGDALALSKTSLRFMERRRGEDDNFAHHFLAHQLSHHTSEAAALLRKRTGYYEGKD